MYASVSSSQLSPKVDLDVGQVSLVLTQSAYGQAKSRAVPQLLVVESFQWG